MMCRKLFVVLLSTIFIGGCAYGPYWQSFEPRPDDMQGNCFSRFRNSIEQCVDDTFSPVKCRCERD